MRTTFETELIQNTAVGATALWRFSVKYIGSEPDAGPDLWRLFLVLPIVFHKRSAETISSRHFKTGLLKILYDSPDLVLGLQDRVEAMYLRTLRSLSLACSAGLLERRSIPGGCPAYSLARKTVPEGLRPVSREVKITVSAAERLGAWFSGHDLPFLCSQLHVRF